MYGWMGGWVDGWVDGWMLAWCGHGTKGFGNKQTNLQQLIKQFRIAPNHFRGLVHTSRKIFELFLHQLCKLLANLRRRLVLLHGLHKQTHAGQGPVLIGLLHNTGRGVLECDCCQ